MSVMCKTKDDHEIEVKVTFSWRVDRDSVLRLIGSTKNPLADLTYALKLDVSKVIFILVYFYDPKISQQNALFVAW